MLIASLSIYRPDRNATYNTIQEVVRGDGSLNQNSFSQREDTLKPDIFNLNPNDILKIPVEAPNQSIQVDNLLSNLSSK